MSDESKKQDQAELDQGFNDAELQDIMSEIESLEQEFTEGVSAEVDVADDEDLDSEMMEACAEDEIESEEDEEMFAELEDLDEDSEPVFAEVTPLASKPPKSSSPAAACPMSFSAQGQMEMKMTFAVGDEQVEVWTNAEGLNLTMNGVTVQISEQEGCVIEWPGGMKFTLPHSSKAHKKAA